MHHPRTPTLSSAQVLLARVWAVASQTLIQSSDFEICFWNGSIFHPPSHGTAFHTGGRDTLDRKEVIHICTVAGELHTSLLSLMCQCCSLHVLTQRAY
jgi:hypothetical protein